MDYLVLRACERLDPRSVWGKSYQELGPEERLALLGYDKLRTAELMELDLAKLKATAGRGIF